MVKLAEKISLTPREFAFAEAVLQGMNNSDALRHAYPELIKKWKPSSIHEKASKMRKDRKIDGYIQEQMQLRQRRRLIKESELLTRLEKRAILADCARNDRGEWPHRMAAIKIDNEMSGDAVVRVEEEITIAHIMKRIGDAKITLDDEEQRLLRATPVQAIAIEQNGHASNGHSNGNGHKAKVEGPFAQDFQTLGEVWPEATNASEAPPPTTKRRFYEE